MGTADHYAGSTAGPAAPRSAWLLYGAVALFIVGLVSLVVLFLYPAVADGHRAPGVVGGLTLCLPAGLLVALIFALTSGRRVRKPRLENR